MSISRGNFNRQCLEFIDKVRELDEYHEWTVNRVEEAGIEQLDNVLRDLDSANLMLMKTHIKLSPPHNLVQTHEYSVVYSESYEVPVMYFSASYQDGSPIDLTDFFPNSEGSDGKDLRQTINQVEHPLLFRPFYMIHPCKTRDFMEGHLEEHSDRYLLSWLSILGTLLDLKLNLKLAG